MKSLIAVAFVAFLSSFASPVFSQFENDPARREQLEREMRRSNPDYLKPLPREESTHARRGLSSWYVGLAFGQTDAREICNLFSANVSCDDTATAWKVFGGYRFNSNFALEGGYGDVGKFVASDPGGTASIEGNVWDVVGVGIIPIGDHGVFGKLGIYRSEAKGRADHVLLTGSERTTGTDLTFGF